MLFELSRRAYGKKTNASSCHQLNPTGANSGMVGLNLITAIILATNRKSQVHGGDRTSAESSLLKRRPTGLDQSLSQSMHWCGEDSINVTDFDNSS